MGIKYDGELAGADRPEPRFDCSSPSTGMEPTSAPTGRNARQRSTICAKWWRPPRSMASTPC